MSTCQAKKKSGLRCTHRAESGLAVCGKHASGKQEMCIGKNPSGRRCAQIPSKGNFCGKHHKQYNQKIERDNAERLWNDLWLEWLHYEMTAVDILDELDRLRREKFMTRAWYDVLYERGRGLMRQEQLEREPEFHDDPQNVHRTVVSEQTNKGLKIYLEQELDIGSVLGPFNEILITWGTYPKELMEDMRKWWQTASCRDTDDWLYVRALSGLWEMIKPHEHFEELLRRLKEETTESIGMCCEGHLSRLVNVMVGFDPRFEPPVSTKELLQHKMAEISAKEITAEEKQNEAKQWMDEHGIVEAERGAWLEAL